MPRYFSKFSHSTRSHNFLRHLLHYTPQSMYSVLAACSASTSSKNSYLLTDALKSCFLCSPFMLHLGSSSSLVDSDSDMAFRYSSEGSAFFSCSVSFLSFLRYPFALAIHQHLLFTRHSLSPNFFDQSFLFRLIPLPGQHTFFSSCSFILFVLD